MIYDDMNSCISNKICEHEVHSISYAEIGFCNIDDAVIKQIIREQNIYVILPIIPSKTSGYLPNEQGSYLRYQG